MNSKRMPDLIEVLTDEHGGGVDVLIDGHSVPYYLGPDVTVDLADGGRMTSICVSVLAHRVVIRTADQVTQPAERAPRGT